MVKLTLVVFQWGEVGPISYKVQRVVGSVDYWPGQVLTRFMVKDLCTMTGMFQVTVEKGEARG